MTRSDALVRFGGAGDLPDRVANIQGTMIEEFAADAGGWSPLPEVS